MSENKLDRRKTAWLLTGLMASLLLSALDSTVVSTAMKSIAGDLRGMQFYAWPFTLYTLCATVAIPICGGLADIYGHKPLFLSGIGLFLTGSALCGSARSMSWLIAFRGLQGIGGGMIVSGVFTAVADMFGPRERGKYTGLVTSMYGLASIIGPLAGGFITDSLGWRWIFYVNLPLGAFAAAVVAVAMPQYSASGRRKTKDIPGIAALVLTFVPFLLCLSEAGKSFAWGSLPCVGLLAFAAAMLAVFVRIEKRSENPLIPLGFFRNGAIGVSFALAFLSQAVMFAAIIYLPYFVQGVIGSDAATSGLVVMPMMIGLLLASNVVGVCISRFGRLRLMSVCAFAVMGAGAILLSRMGVSTSYPDAILSMLILGAGVGISMPITSVNAQNAAPREQLGSVTSTVMFFRNMGSTVGSAVYGVIMSSAFAAGIAKTDMGRLPAEIQAPMKNIQVVTSAQSVASIRAKLPSSRLSDFDGAYLRVREVLASSVGRVFLVCAGIAAAGLLVSLFLKEAPVSGRKER